MTSERIKEIQEETAYPNSVSVQQALLKVWNECVQEPKQETQGYICPQTKKQCDDECCVSAEDCHIEAGIDVISEPKQERMYSDEDLAEAFEAGKKVGEDNACMAENYRREDFKEWFEQFKNK